MTESSKETLAERAKLVEQVTGFEKDCNLCRGTGFETFIDDHENPVTRECLGGCQGSGKVPVVEGLRRECWGCNGTGIAKFDGTIGRQTKCNYLGCHGRGWRPVRPAEAVMAIRRHWGYLLCRRKLQTSDGWEAWIDLQGQMICGEATDDCCAIFQAAIKALEATL